MRQISWRCALLVGLSVLFLMPAPSFPQNGRVASAIGHVRISNGQYCGGVLIGPRRVLTAAHCLVRPNGRRRDPSEISFHYGGRDTRARAVALYPHPRFRITGGANLQAMSFDLGVVVLAPPDSAARVRPMSIAPFLERGARLAALVADRRRPRRIPCRISDQVGMILVLGCDVDRGMSGAPIVRWRSGRAEIVAIISSRTIDGGQREVYAARTDLMRNWIESH